MQPDIEAIVQERILAHYRELGSRGGKARVANESPEVRSERGKMAAKARWAKKEAETKAKGSAK